MSKFLGAAPPCLYVDDDIFWSFCHGVTNPSHLVQEKKLMTTSVMLETKNSSASHCRS